MENDKELTYGNVIGALAACGIVGWLMYDMYSNLPIISIVIWVLIVGFVAMIIISNRMVKGTNYLENCICKQLDNLGYQHEKQEGELYVRKNDNSFRIQLSDGTNRRIKHLFVIYDFGDDNFDKISKDGWNRVANSININNPRTVFVTLEDHFCCCYQTAIGNAEDFMSEFERAYYAIGEAMKDYNRIYPYVERDYPNVVVESNSIGFKTGT